LGNKKILIGYQESLCLVKIFKFFRDKIKKIKKIQLSERWFCTKCVQFTTSYWFGKW